MNNGESIRDRIEIDRTFQANKKTLLEYLRTCLGLLVAGVGLVYFSHQDWFGTVGIACILIGVFSTIIGVALYRKMNSSISLIVKRFGIDRSSMTLVFPPPQILEMTNQNLIVNTTN